MASGTSSLDSGSSGAGTLPRNYGVATSERGDRNMNTGSPRDYDGLKQLCDKAMMELQLLRRQHSDTIRRCDDTMKELDYCRGKNRVAMSQLESAAQDSSALRVKCGELAADNLRLEQHVTSLQRELAELRAQESASETGASDTLNHHYKAARHKYEAVKDDYEALRKRYDDLIATHSAAVNKCELAQEEVGRYKTQCEELMQERNVAILERNALQQQCTAAIRKWDIALRERNEYREAVAKVQQQHEEAVKEINQAMAVRMKASKDLKRLTEERNAAMQEYTLIMSERDMVHKEMEKLSDDLAQACKTNQTLEAENKEYIEMKKALSYQIETLKREIASALHDRDKALKECNDLRERFGEFTAKEESNRDLKARADYNAYIRERDNGHKDQGEVSTSTRDLYSKSQRERMDNLDQANQELDRLRKLADKLQAELQEANQEAEVSKHRRDWAFNERDKIVLERESIRTLCDRLRKERDRAVSDLAEALRDSDDIKKQRNEAAKELKRLKEKLEAQIEKENQAEQFHAAGHNHSHDSAIDSDLQEWESEILEIDLSGLASNGELGFELVGGRDDPQYPNDSGIYVSSVAKGSVFDGKLKVNDCISRVNNVDCSNVSKRVVMEAIRSYGGGTANVFVRRRRVTRNIYATQLNLRMGEHGLSLETGIYISKMSPGSLAAKEGTLAVGDRVLSINNKPMDGLSSARDAMAILEGCGDVATITTLKSSSSGSTHSSCEEERSFSTTSSPSKDSAPIISSLPRSSDHGSYAASPVGSTSPSTLPRPRPRGVGHKHSACQTDSIGVKTPELLIDRRYQERVIYPMDKNSSEKVSTSSGGSASPGWGELVRDKIDLRGRCHKEYTFQDKKRHDNASPVATDQEESEAIAKLDSVIDSYHRPGAPSGATNSAVTGTVLRRSKRRNKEQDKNGGTWPKARAGPSMRHSTGTVLHPRKNKERMLLSVFLREPTNECDRLSDTSMDLSVKDNMAKDVLDYYVKKKDDNLKYPPSDSESNASPVPTAHNRIQSQLYPLRPLPHYPFVPIPVPHLHPHPHLGNPLSPSRYPTPQYSSPMSIHLPSSPSGESIGLSDTRNYCFEPPHSPPQSFLHSHSPSDHYHRPPRSLLGPRAHFTTYQGNEEISGSYAYESGTFPRKKENARFRIPSNPSVTSKISTGSMERPSERDSPLPTFHVDILSHGHHTNKRNSLPDYCWSQRPAPGELRKVHIEKAAEPLGIQIHCSDTGGVFVSSVNENSLASQVGLQVGDQLLEVCGINLRNATYPCAANVLRQCGDSITMLVQYAPDKYKMENSESDGDENPSRSGSPTPRNSPRTTRKNEEQRNLIAPHGTLTRSQIAQVAPSLGRQANNAMHTPRSSVVQSDDPSKALIPLDNPRRLHLETRKCNNLGISLLGGNAVGIFVHSVQPDSLAYNAGLRTGDQILEYNGSDLRHATAEEAAYELAKPADKVEMLAQYRLERYNEVKDKPGDSFYIRALFDRVGDVGDSRQLRFHKDDVLFVDNTLFNGVPGHWRAWRLDENGRRQQWGVIPSKYKVEEELRNSQGDLEADVRRGSTSARRSFFRRKKHQRSASQDSKELASFSSINLGWYSDSGTLHDETPLATYQRVERVHYPVYRPVLVVGPLSDCVTDRLELDFPDLFTRCQPVILEKGVSDPVFIDCKKKGSYYEYTTVSAIRDVCEKSSHCLLDISLGSVERLHRHQIYPIVLLIKFKSTKQIKEVKDTRCAMDKVSAKAAKEMYEHALKLESENRHLISSVIPAGSNIAYMCTQIKAAVDVEQRKTLWVPSSVSSLSSSS